MPKIEIELTDDEINVVAMHQNQPIVGFLTAFLKDIIATWDDRQEKLRVYENYKKLSPEFKATIDNVK